MMTPAHDKQTPFENVEPPEEKIYIVGKNESADADHDKRFVVLHLDPGECSDKIRVVSWHATSEEAVAAAANAAENEGDLDNDPRPA